MHLARSTEGRLEMKKAVKIIGFAVIGIVLFWLFGLKLIIKLMKKGSAPCPSSLS
jgi:plastocyanin domain-containing protein